MADPVQLKASRKARKGIVTKEINAAERFMAEDNIEEVRSKFDKIKKVFEEFEEAHESFHATVTEEDAVDESEEYFYKVQKDYVQAITSIKAWLTSEDRKAPAVGVTPPAVQIKNEDITRSELLGIINMPSVKLDEFDGDPLQYHSFFAIFDERVDRVTTDGRVKLSRLQGACIGDAKKAIRCCSLIEGEEGYREARNILKKRFGSEYVISDRIIKNLKQDKPVRTAEEIQQFSDDVCNSYATLSKMGRLNEIDTQTSILEIVKRTPQYLQNRWKKSVFEYKRKHEKYPSFKEFMEFVMEVAEEVTDPIYGSGFSNKSTSEHKSRSMAFTTRTDHERATKSSECIVCQEDHRLFNCEKFKSMRPAERLRLVRSHELCHICLYSNHATNDCRRTYVCSVPGCGQRHTKFIHVNPPQSADHNARHTSENIGVVNQADVNNCNVNTNVDVLVPLVKVTVNETYETSVLLDTGSTTSFCTQRLVDELGLNGITVDYSLNTLNDSGRSKRGKLVDLSLMSNDGSTEFKLSSVYVVESIPVNQQAVDFHSYSHISDLPIAVLPGKVDVLIGQDHADALVPLQVRRGKEGEPFAIRTLLGWSVNGPVTSNVKVGKSVISNFITTSKLESDIQKLWDIENENASGDDSGWSQEDKHVIELWDKQVRMVGNHYQLPIPWRENVEIPNNLPVAMSRLKSLKNSLDKRHLTEKYNAEISKLCEKGYAEKIPQDQVTKSKNTWYLPHQAVLSEKKPGKLRVVYDCASKYLGQSLNDKAFQGPDLTNKLLHVLLRFRNHHYAITADIEAMYYQVLVDNLDVDCLRFLWFDKNGSVEHYRMVRHVFGGVWSGCAASYALRRTAVEFAEKDSIPSRTILESFYVDDCLVSVKSYEEARTIILGTRELLGHGGFKLTKFVVNNDDLKSFVPIEDQAVEEKEFQSNSQSRILGLIWNVQEDRIKFDVKMESQVAVTRRGMLSVLSSLYDPLGLMSPVLITGKVLFQDVTRMKFHWDRVVPSDIQMKWFQWINSLQALAAVSVQRCVKPSKFDDAAMELHHFSDANERAYGCCSYLRCINKSGDVHVALLYSKGRVAPLKTISIPRLELQAAVLAARADVMLRKELHLDLCESKFWVDSEIVLNYIYNDSRRFQVYVANRISEIRSTSQPAQWNHIAGTRNPADLITRGQHPSVLIDGCWINGPEFLRTYKCNWNGPTFEPDLMFDDPEIKQSEKHTVCLAVEELSTHPIDVLISHFSSWYRLQRALAWWIRLRDRLLRRELKDKGPLVESEVRNAEIQIIKHVQMNAFRDEIKVASATKFRKSSHLRDLSPFVNEQGVLCVGGRMKHADMLSDNKHPFIVPYNHPIAKMIVVEYHNIAHLGTEWTLSQVRRRFWITKVRSVIKGVKRDCIVCKKLFAPAEFQRMADLPPERLSVGQPPFSFTGVDCFGPFNVKVGRAEVKRYGCIFTCFNVRAVHIEKLDHMDTDSFLNCFRRFCARRGSPAQVWSDNGTNFVGAKNELIRSVGHLDRDKIQAYFTQNGVEWTFHPPSASHWGGVWERMIRTTRKVMTAILGNTRLTDEILSTVFCEAEGIINSRPITKVSSDPSDPSPLTPHHLLMLKGGPPPPPGKYQHADTYRKRWRHVQYLADQFWKRWIREYLPTLQSRNKWIDKKRNLQVGDLVLLVDENTPRSLWPLGLISEVIPGRDGLIRSVNIKTKSSNLKRPVTKVVLLEVV